MYYYWKITGIQAKFQQTLSMDMLEKNPKSNLFYNPNRRQLLLNGDIVYHTYTCSGRIFDDNQETSSENNPNF